MLRVAMCAVGAAWVLERLVHQPACLATTQPQQLNPCTSRNPALCPLFGMRRCVGRGCECAVESCVDRTADEPLDVMCTTCGATFCFSCKEEAHRPVGRGCVATLLGAATLPAAVHRRVGAAPCPCCREGVRRPGRGSHPWTPTSRLLAVPVGW